MDYRKEVLMNNISKVMSVALPCICMANATTITLDENYKGNNGYFKFDVTESKDGYNINWISLESRTYNNEEANLVIPGQIKGKDVSLGHNAFAWLKADGLDINLLIDDGVKMPRDSAGLFYFAKSLKQIGFGKVDM